MFNIPITNVPVQSFSIRLDENFYDITIRMCAASKRVEPFYAAATIVMDVVRDNVPIVLGMHCVPGTPVIPYAYLAVGNFIWQTENNELLDYNQFNVSQFLIYASADELAVINSTPLELT